jgi:GNAT superfamily N-acetyltransferase
LELDVQKIYTEEFEKKIVKKIAFAFGCEESEFYRVGNLVISQPNLKNSNRMNIYSFENKSFLLIDPNHFKTMKQIIVQNFRQKTVTESDITSFFGFQVEVLSADEQFYYLDPAFFSPEMNIQGYAIKNLTLHDKESYYLLQESCLAHEWEEAYIQLEHGIIFGIWKEDNLIGVANSIDWDGIVSDIGMIIHPGYRNIGLGKLLLSALCEWGIKENIILQFRCANNQEKIGNLIRKIGFKPFMDKLACQFDFSNDSV